MSGLRAYVLPLKWPAALKPLELHDFETQARKLRYQALGTACRDLGLPVLMTAHHSDDVVETLLMRLTTGHTGAGLHGIKANAPIPECWGMHGVHASGQIDIAEEMPGVFSRSWKEQSPSHIAYVKNGYHKFHSRPIMENGGIDVLRPLLTYSKDDLIMTCQAADVSWEEDKTNSDPQRTPRNAIRSLLSSGKLPLALAKPSILALTKSCQKRSNILNSFLHRIEYQPHVIAFDTRSGVLIVRMVKDIFSMLLKDTSPEVVSKQQIAVRILERTMSDVTPLETIKLKKLKTAADIVFGDIKRLSLIEPSQSISFTAGGVRFLRIHSSTAEYRKLPHNIDSQDKSAQNLLDPHFIWSLSRQPFTEHLTSLKIPSLAHSTENGPFSKTTWTPWQLWDGRYWIKVKNLSTRPLLIRPFLPTDLHTIKETVPKEVWRQLREALADCAPGKVRWTLPAIAQSAVDESSPGRVLALPSIGIPGLLYDDGQENIKQVDWKIRYKMTSLRSRRCRHAV